jgi:D-threo-aldose 1-dehydrogenase
MKISERRAVTRSGLELTILGLGGAAFGGLYAATSVTDAFGAMRKGWDAGIRYFDVASMYGLGRAEHLLGHFLRKEIGDGESLALSTKAGRLMARSRPVGICLPLRRRILRMQAGKMACGSRKFSTTPMMGSCVALTAASSG